MLADRAPAIGVEEEFLLVDTDSRLLTAGSEAVVTAARSVGIAAERELTLYQVETNAPPLKDVRAVHEHVIDTRRTLSAVAVSQGVDLVALGLPTTPVPDRGNEPITDSERYRLLAANYGALAFDDASCGCHVHVEVPDKATAIAAGNHLRPWLPTLLAMTANSAVHGGADTGFASWRSVLWGRWPTAGPPPFLRSVSHYDEVVGTLLQTRTILDEANLYWDVRPSSHQPTVEIRVSDVPAVADDTALLAALVRALVLTAQWSHERGDDPPEPERTRLEAAYFCARKHGLDGNGVDPMTGRAVRPRLLIEQLVHHVRPALAYTGDLDHVASLLQRLAHNGNGASRQRRVFAATGDAVEVMKMAVLATTTDGTAQCPVTERAAVGAHP
ncbi:MAG: glutamate--cysteine ligase [Rhodococcus sp. (in: high G+C Gram-positive bacteria)]